MAFIDAHRERFGVEPMCRVLSAHGVRIAPSTFYAARKRPPSARARRDVELVVEIRRDNFLVPPRRAADPGAPHPSPATRTRINFGEKPQVSGYAAISHARQ